MIHQFAYGMKILLGKDRAGRHLTVYDDDIFLTSFPKSGNTWTRFLVANLIHPQEPVTFLNIERIIPEPELQSRRFLKNCPSPRVLKSHSPFDPRYKKVVHIVRDPRDVALSQYYFQVKRGMVPSETPIEEFVQRFVKGETSDYGSWGQNVGSWLITRYNTPGFLLLRYEDLKERPEEELARVATFLGINADRALLAKAVECSSADHMRSLEKLQADQWTLTKKTRKDISFVRTAVAGGWKSNLTPQAVSHIERAWGPMMRALGYKTDANSADEKPSFLDLVELSNR
jgi:hypothetical protein